MFEDQQPKQPAPPANLPSEPLDMFAEVEGDVTPAAPPIPNALGAGLLKKKTEAIAPPSIGKSTSDAQPVYSMKEPVLGKILLIVLMVVAVGGLAYGGYWGYQKFFAVAPPSDETETAKTTNNTPAPADNTAQQIVIPETPPTTTETATTTPPATVPPVTTTDISAQMNNDKILFGEPVDTDKDNLDDVRERELGTSPTNPDTDGDCLTDYQEVVIYKTNPLNPDSDGDGYFDGEEVLSGYNPLGPGKMGESVSEMSTTTAAVMKKCVSKKKGVPAIVK